MRRLIRCQHDRNLVTVKGVKNMKPITIGCSTMGLVIGLALMASTALGQNPPSPRPFVIYDALYYFNKPDLSVHGLQPITLAGGGTLGPDWNKQPDRLPLIEFVQAVARNAQQKGVPVVLDIEHWPLNGPPDVVQPSLQKYLTVLTWAQNAAPGLSVGYVGYYGAPPLRDYWRAVKGPSS
jgi:hypothetical protein